MKRSRKKLIPVLIVVLGLFTFGISDLIWIYTISDKVDFRKFLPAKQLALTAITLGVYGILWTYRISNEINKSILHNDKLNPILCTILSIVFLRPISTALIYSKLIEENTMLGEQDK